MQKVIYCALRAESNVQTHICRACSSKCVFVHLLNQLEQMCVFIFDKRMRQRTLRILKREAFEALSAI